MFGKIIGTGSYVPEKLLTNDYIAHFVETSDEWIKERTGVETRHVMDKENTSEMAVYASWKAMESADINPEEIDMIIVSTVSSDLILPNTACFVQEKIGAVNAICLDINTACTGFIMAYNTVQSYINAGLIDTALIIGAEGLSRIVDWSDRSTCILFGDGAGAVIVRKNEKAVFDTVMHADGGKGSALTCKNSHAKRKSIFEVNKYNEVIISNNENDCSDKKEVDSTYVRMDGQEIFRFAVKQVPICINELMNKMNITDKDIDLYLLHQANKRILQSVIKRLDIDEEKVPMNVTKYGNTSSACIPMLLDELVKSQSIKSGDKIIMSGFGAGLTWGATYLEL